MNKKIKNPAQSAQSSESSESSDITFMEKEISSFADFVVESMGEGHHESFEDHYEFMKAALEAYIEE